MAHEITNIAGAHPGLTPNYLTGLGTEALFSGLDTSGDTGPVDDRRDSASSTFVARSSYNASGDLMFTVDPTATIHTYGYTQGRSQSNPCAHWPMSTAAAWIPSFLARLQHPGDQDRMRITFGQDAQAIHARAAEAAASFRM